MNTYAIKRFASSSGVFLWRWLKRSVVGISILCLKLSDIYSSFLRPRMSEPWVSITDSIQSLANGHAIWIAVTILIVALLYTHYEVAREIRDPAVTSRLKQFYIEFGNLFERAVASDDDLAALTIDVDAKCKQIREYVSNNMSGGSLVRLLQQKATGLNQFGVARADAHNTAHSQLLDRIIKIQESILVLIERPVWV